MITAENLTKRQGPHTVLDAFDLSVAPGELVALVGPSDAGKTTALDLIEGLQVPNAGRITVAGFDLAREPTQARAHLACVPARLALPEKASGLSHLRDACARLGRRIPAPVLVAALLRGGPPAEWHPRRLRRRGLAILLATRDLAFARRLATRIVLLEGGAIVETFDPNAPRHATEARAYLADLIA